MSDQDMQLISPDEMKDLPINDQNKDLSTKSLSVADRMKKHEAIYDTCIPNDHYLCIRLDGHSFSKFTRNLQKPYDPNFSKAMVHAAYDALSEFNAKCAYTQSDEITLIFDIPDLSKGQSYIYNGRIQKLSSLSASFVSTRFNYYLKKFIADGKITYTNETLTRINNAFATFDARILTFDKSSKNEILNHIIWRSIKDCYRNAVQSYAYHHFGSKRINNLNGKQMIELLEKEKEIKWATDVPLWQKYGIYIKKELVLITTENGSAHRARMVSVSFKPYFSQSIIDFFLDSYFDKDKLENTVSNPDQFQMKMLDLSKFDLQDC